MRPLLRLVRLLLMTLCIRVAVHVLRILRCILMPFLLRRRVLVMLCCVYDVVVTIRAAALTCVRLRSLPRMRLLLLVS